MTGINTPATVIGSVRSPSRGLVLVRPSEVDSLAFPVVLVVAVMAGTGWVGMSSSSLSSWPAEFDFNLDEGSDAVGAGTSWIEAMAGLVAIDPNVSCLPPSPLTPSFLERPLPELSSRSFLLSSCC